MASGPSFVRGRVVDVSGGRCVLEFPEDNWGRNVAMVVSALVAGEGVETRSFTRWRLVSLSLPDGFLPGPALGAEGVGITRPAVGVIV